MQSPAVQEMRANEKTALLTPGPQQQQGESSVRVVHVQSLAIRERFRQRYAARRISIWAAVTLTLLLLTLFHLSARRESVEKKYTFEFDSPPDLSIIESIDLPSIAVHGQVRVREAAADQKPAVNVQVSLLAKLRSNDFMGLAFKHSSTELKIVTAQKPNLRWRWWPRPCLDLDLLISVAKDVTVHNFNISSDNLSIYLDPALSITVTNQTTLTTNNGAISHPALPDGRAVNPFYSRKTVIYSRSGAITGTYNLYDLLWLITRSGQVAVTATPQPASISPPEQPAQLIAVTRSGRIDIRVDALPTVPARDYRTTVHSRSGRITGTYLHGSTTQMLTRSGDISASVVPFNASTEAPSFLVTESKSGHHDIRVERPLHLAADGSLGAMESRHSTKSGRVTLEYPQEWTGAFEGYSKSGALDVIGPGLEFERKERGLVVGHKTVEGVESTGRLVIWTKSGDGSLRFVG